MMNWFTRKITGPINFYSMYNGARCMNDYTSYKIDIEREIDNFEKNTSGNYYKAWEKLNKYITEKNNSLKECYRNRHIGVTLIEDDKIKNFMNRCSSNRRCNNPSRQALRTPSSNPETKRSCKGPNDCKETAKPKEAKHQTKPTAAVVASKTRSSSRQNSDDQAHSHAAVTGSKTESVNLEKQTSIGQSVPSVKADTEAPEQRDNIHSGVSGQTETQTQSALDSAVEKENVVDPNLSNASSQGISDGGSLSISTSPLKDLETHNHQGGPRGSTDISGKNPGEHSTVVEGKTASDKNCAKTSCPENLTGGTPGRGENVDGHSQQIVANSVVTDRISVFSGDSVSVDLKTANYDKVLPVHLPAGDRDANPLTPGCENSHGVNCQSKVSGVKPTEENPESDDAVENPRSGDVSSHGSQITQKHQEDSEAEGKESKQREQPESRQYDKLGEEQQLHICSQKNLGGSSPSSHGICVSHESNYAKSAPISEDNSERNKLSEQYGVAPDMDTKESATTGDGIELHESSLNRYLILYKNYIIMALISLVVILLLTILLKCTPLGTLFTKKKEKKRKQMNEKLQRVLVEPSNAREERNIQFAYSAFEYLK